MLLQRLVEYADRIELPPTLYTKKPVRYIIELASDGELLSPEPVDTSDPSSRHTKRGQPRPVPDVQGSVNIRPLLLASNSEYTFGIAREKSKPTRVALCHQAYLEQVHRCADTTGEEAVKAVSAFLKSQSTPLLRLNDDFDPDGIVTFRVNGVFPIDLPSVQAFWVAENDPSVRDAPIMQCLICGQERPVLERLQGKIKGIPGGQMSGTSIISANEKAFESYGLEASLIAPTCSECGEKFTKAANHLISGPESHITVGNAVFIFWTREDVSFNIYSVITDPKPEEVKSLLNSVHAGRKAADFDDMAFYATALSALQNSGRAIVRDYIDTTVGYVRHNLARWFQRQEIVDPERDVPQPFGLYKLALATVREMKDLPVTTPRALLRAALSDTPLPMDLLYQAVRRSRAEQGVTRPRAALIKLVLSSQGKIKEDEMIKLDENYPDSAYHCGRLLAVLGDIQRNAVGTSSVVNRFYGTMSTAPFLVLSTVVGNAIKGHLPKLERDKPGLHSILQEQLQSILGRIHPSELQGMLNPARQGLFMLGYYHQRAEGIAQMNARIERRKAKESTNSKTEESNIDQPEDVNEDDSTTK